MKLIYFSPVNWHSYAQRPHYLIRYLLENNVVSKVLWINPYPTRLPRFSDIFRKKGSDKLPEPFQLENLEIKQASALPIEPLPGGAFINRTLFWSDLFKEIKNWCAEQEKTVIGVGRPSAMALLALNEFSYHSSFYDAMDDFPAFYQGLSKIQMAARERQLASMVTKLWCSAPEIIEKFKNLNKSVQLVTNGYEMSNLPEIEQKPLLEHKKTFGYVGTISNWFDWGQVIELSEQNPDILIKLVGPVFTQIPDLPDNIELFPACSQHEAIEYIQSFDIGIIPFTIDELTQGVDPIKYYEYRALGKPVLSSKFGLMPEHSKSGGVYFFEDCIDDCFERVLKMKPTIQDVKLFRKANDWNSRFKYFANWFKSVNL